MNANLVGFIILQMKFWEMVLKMTDEDITFNKKRDEINVNDPVICPNCGSLNVIQTPEGKLTFKCLDCGFTWDEERIHCVPDEQEFGSDENPNYRGDEEDYGYGGEEGLEDAYSEEEEFWFE